MLLRYASRFRIEFGFKNIHRDMQQQEAAGSQHRHKCVNNTHTLFDKTDMAAKQQRYICYVLHMLHASAYMQLHM